MRKKKIIIIKISVIILVFLMLSVTIITFLKRSTPKSILGVWWWNDTLSDEYLDFAKNNNVTEIYYCHDDFNEDTNLFIEKAKSQNI